VTATIPYPHISPDILRFGPIALRWYGMMYLVGYVVGVSIARRRVRRGLVPFDVRAVDTLVVYLVIGMLVGARLVYVLVYDRPQYAAHPLDVIAIWRGGLSFHGALIGMTCACVLFARRFRVPFWTVADTLALAGPPGLFFGRLGNFINGELYGRPSGVAWAMVFPSDPRHLARHPSQIYEAVGEGIMLFVLIRTLERRAVIGGWYWPGSLSAAFLLGYGALRFLIEFTREPDAQLGLVLGPFSMGQLLSAIMSVAGLIVAAFTYQRSARRSQATEVKPRIDQSAHS
jgi:phosphatidylglycerol---prolipoprotein diacylglyceryl transferase